MYCRGRTLHLLVLAILTYALISFFPTFAHSDLLPQGWTPSRGARIIRYAESEVKSLLGEAGKDPARQQEVRALPTFKILEAQIAINQKRGDAWETLSPEAKSLMMKRPQVPSITLLSRVKAALLAPKLILVKIKGDTLLNDAERKELRRKVAEADTIIDELLAEHYGHAPATDKERFALLAAIPRVSDRYEFNQELKFRLGIRLPHLDAIDPAEVATAIRMFRVVRNQYKTFVGNDRTSPPRLGNYDSATLREKYDSLVASYSEALEGRVDSSQLKIQAELAARIDLLTGLAGQNPLLSEAVAPSALMHENSSRNIVWIFTKKVLTWMKTWNQGSTIDQALSRKEMAERAVQVLAGVTVPEQPTLAQLTRQWGEPGKDYRIASDGLPELKVTLTGIEANYPINIANVTDEEISSLRSGEIAVPDLLRHLRVRLIESGASQVETCEKLSFVAEHLRDTYNGTRILYLRPTDKIALVKRITLTESQVSELADTGLISTLHLRDLGFDHAAYQTRIAEAGLTPETLLVKSWDSGYFGISTVYSSELRREYERPITRNPDGTYEVFLDFEVPADRLVIVKPMSLRDHFSLQMPDHLKDKNDLRGYGFFAPDRLSVTFLENMPKEYLKKDSLEQIRTNLSLLKAIPPLARLREAQKRLRDAQTAEAKAWTNGDRNLWRLGLASDYAQRDFVSAVNSAPSVDRLRFMVEESSARVLSEEDSRRGYDIAKLWFIDHPAENPLKGANPDEWHDAEVRLAIGGIQRIESRLDLLRKLYDPFRVTLSDEFVKPLLNAKNEGTGGIDHYTNAEIQAKRRILTPPIETALKSKRLQSVTLAKTRDRLINIALNLGVAGNPGKADAPEKTPEPPTELPPPEKETTLAPVLEIRPTVVLGPTPEVLQTEAAVQPQSEVFGPEPPPEPPQVEKPPPVALIQSEPEPPVRTPERVVPAVEYESDPLLSLPDGIRTYTHWLADPKVTVADVVAHLSKDPMLKVYYSGYAHQHVLEVGAQLQSQQTFYNLAGIRDPLGVHILSVIKTITALHDIKNPTVNIVMRRLGHSEAEIILAEAIINYNVLSNLAGNKIQSSEARTLINEIANRCGMSEVDFFKFQNLFFIADLTSDPKVRKSAFDEVNGMLAPKSTRYSELMNLYGVSRSNSQRLASTPSATARAIANAAEYTPPEQLNNPSPAQIHDALEEIRTLEETPQAGPISAIFRKARLYEKIGYNTEALDLYRKADFLFDAVRVSLGREAKLAEIEAAITQIFLDEMREAHLLDYDFYLYSEVDPQSVIVKDGKSFAPLNPKSQASLEDPYHTEMKPYLETGRGAKAAMPGSFHAGIRPQVMASSLEDPGLSVSVVQAENSTSEKVPIRLKFSELYREGIKFYSDIGATGIGTYYFTLPKFADGSPTLVPIEVTDPEKLTGLTHPSERESWFFRAKNAVVGPLLNLFRSR